MELKKESLRLTIAVFFALVFIVLLVFFPRIPANPIIIPGPTGELLLEVPSFWGEYKSNLVNFFKNLWEQKSLGETMFQFTKVEDELVRYFPKSLLIIMIAFVLSICIGMWKGIFDYRNTHTRKNVLGNGTTWLFQSIPDFFVVIAIFGLSFYFLPHGKIFSNSNWYSFVAPALLASIYPIMYVARLTAVSLLNQDGQDYIRTAFAKGNAAKQVIHKHILRNSFIDMVAHLPTIIIVIISNLMMVEYLTGFEGAANRMFNALGGRQSSGGAMLGVHIEAGLVLGFALCFMATILLVHILKIILLAKLNKKGL